MTIPIRNMRGVCQKGNGDVDGDPTNATLRAGNPRGGRMLRNHLLRMLLSASFVVALSSFAGAQSLLDTFESPTLNPLIWSKIQQYGTVSLSTEQNKTLAGHQSLKLSSTSGGQRNIGVTHHFAVPQKGTFSIWFYDAAAGEETQYEQISLYNSVTTDLASVGTQDFDAYCYEAQLYNSLSGQQQGPNQDCGLYPQVSTTNVQRTTGWHNLSIVVETDHVVLVIDGKAVFTAAGSYAYDSVTIEQSGLDWRPNTYSFWDDYVGPVWTGS